MKTMNPCPQPNNLLAILLITSVALTGSILRAAESPATPNDILFADDFENGISSSWLKTDLVQVVAEEADQKTNHFARMADNQALLNSPPAKLAVPGSCTPNDLKRWTDYELSFRVRVGNPTAPAGQTHSGSMLQLFWNISPSADNKYESRQFYLVNWLPTQTWFGNGPLIPWFGKNGPFEGSPIKKGIFSFSAQRPKVTGDWQKMRIRQQAGRSQIYFNDELVFDGKDTRAEAGGFALRAIWKKETYDPKYVDIDDIKAIRLTDDTPAEKEKVKP